jgi:ribosomal protein L31
MKHVIVQQTLTYLRRVGVINRQQHGFLTGRSTTTNLQETVERLDNRFAGQKVSYISLH